MYVYYQNFDINLIICVYFGNYCISLTGTENNNVQNKSMIFIYSK